jgi:hypothetical protein
VNVVRSLTTVLEAMQKKGVPFESGLASSEIETIENRYGFRFPPDLRQFLSAGLPVGDDFPNWRTGEIKRGPDSRSIVDMLDWPTEGICFDIQNNGFWMQDWGPKPDALDDAFQVARSIVKQAPPLVPVFSHRFLPAEPLAAGNPVLSVYQTDIIYYSADLASYWIRQFELPTVGEGNGNESPRRIRFWSDMIDQADAKFESERANNE